MNAGSQHINAASGSAPPDSGRVPRESYWAMLSVPEFARSLDPGIIADYKIRFGCSVIITRSDITWLYKYAIHRRDGPAVEHVDGSRSWYLYGKLHRDGGPAAENNHASYWCRHGRLHREDGPAAVYRSGDTAWYINGVKTG